MLSSNGTLITITRSGALIGDGQRWRHIKPPKEAGTPIGLIECHGERLWLTSHRRAFGQSDESSSLPFKLSLEIWPIDSAKPRNVLDWSAQSFRRGLPSLSSLRCGPNGEIYANLFWSYKPWTIGVGLLLVDPSREQVSVWERRQGYDGESALSENPLLPHSTFNTLELGDEHTVYIATNSGLAVANVTPNTPKNDQLKVFDEAYGWPTEFINDLYYESKHSQNPEQDERSPSVWLATPRGLLRLEGEQPLLKIKGNATSLAKRESDHSLWVAFNEQVWVGHREGDEAIDRWTKLKLPKELKISNIKHLLPRENGGLWIIDERGIYVTRDQLIH